MTTTEPAPDPDPFLTLRIPRGLWHDLEDTVYQQDRQFLTEVARTLGLPPAEVIRRCIGTGGTKTTVPVLWTLPSSEDPVACPYWECHGDGLWRRCPRHRLSPSMPCTVHERGSTGTPRSCLFSDPVLGELPWRVPVRRENGELFWGDPTGNAPPFRENGTVEPTLMFRKSRFRDSADWYECKRHCDVT